MRKRRRANRRLIRKPVLLVCKREYPLEKLRLSEHRFARIEKGSVILTPVQCSESKALETFQRLRVVGAEDPLADP